MRILQKTILVFMGITLSVLLLEGSVVQAFSGTGNGTSGNPYSITSCAQLQEVGTIGVHLTQHYKLANDIDCTDFSTNHGWEPIGFYSTDPFTGTLDGDGYTISNISYTGNGPAGLFGYVSGATIKNVTVKDSVFDSVGHVGSIAGDATNATLTHVHANNTTVKADNRLGGLVGIMNNSAISDSSVIDGSITGKEMGSGTVFLGGGVGRSSSSTIQRISVSGSVTGDQASFMGNTDDQIGGLIGASQSDTVSDSYSTASVTGDNKIGGFIGSASSTTVQRSWASGPVTGVIDVGGFYGYEGLSSADNSFAMGEVTGTTNVGGFIGHAVAIGLAMPTSLWDVDRSGISDCVGLDESISFATTCTGINANGAAPNYFFNTTTHTPLSAWDFTNVWRTTTATPKLITSPERPDSVQVTRTSNSLTVTWEVPADTGGTAITAYDLKYYKLDGSVFTYRSGLAPSSVNTYTITGLDADTWYTVEIRATNARGNGPWLGFVTTTNPAAATTTTATATAPTTTAPKSSYISTSSAPENTDFVDNLASGELKNNPQNANTRDNPRSPEQETFNNTDSSRPVLGVLFITAVITVGTLGLLQYVRKPR